MNRYRVETVGAFEVLFTSHVKERAIMFAMAQQRRVIVFDIGAKMIVYRNW